MVAEVVFSRYDGSLRQHLLFHENCGVCLVTGGLLMKVRQGAITAFLLLLNQSGD